MAPSDPQAQAERLERARLHLKWSERQAGAALRNDSHYKIVINALRDGRSPQMKTISALVDGFVAYGFSRRWLLLGEMPEREDGAAVAELPGPARTPRAPQRSAPELPSVSRRGGRGVNQRGAPASPARPVATRVVERDDRYSFAPRVRDELVAEGVPLERAQSVVFGLLFQEGQQGLTEVGLYKAAKHQLAEARGKAVEAPELGDEDAALAKGARKPR